MKKKGLAGILVATSISFLSAGAAEKRPNVLVVMMDDFGAGQFAPLIENLDEASFDPAFVDYVARMKDGRYSNSQALAAARKAMPTMSRLTKDGMLFTRAFAGNALCAPSRCGLATAIHPNRLGIYENDDVNAEPGGLPPGKILMPHFKKAGYLTGHIGKWHLGSLDGELAASIAVKNGLPPGINPTSPKAKPIMTKEGYFGSVPASHHPLNNGFDYYYGYNYHQSKFFNDSNVWEGFNHAGRQEGYNTEIFTEKALEFIKQAGRENKPFFLNFHLHAVHGPLLPNPPEKYMKPFDGMPDSLRNFYGHVYAADEAVRRLVDALAAAGELDNTLIVFTSDNGAAVSRDNTLPGNAPHRGHKGQYVQGGTRVPLVIHWPARLRKGQVTAELASQLDILPTAMDAAGIAAPNDLDGRSLLPLLDGAEQGPHNELVWFGLESCSWGFTDERSLMGGGVRKKEPGAWAVITDDWVLRFTGTVDAGLYKDAPDGIPAHMELYNVKKDPGEKENLAEAFPETVATLKSIAVKRVKQLPPPVHSNRENWQELKDSLDAAPQ